MFMTKNVGFTSPVQGLRCDHKNKNCHYVHFAMIKTQKCFVSFQQMSAAPMVTGKRNLIFLASLLWVSTIMKQKNVFITTLTTPWSRWNNTSFHFTRSKIFIHHLTFSDHATSDLHKNVRNFINFYPQEFQWNSTCFTSLFFISSVPKTTLTKNNN